MILFAYTVHDQAAAAYLPPFFESTDAKAIRAFENAVADPGHQFGRNPEDYNLIKIGTFNDEKGTLDANGHAHLVSGVEALARVNAQQLDLSQMEIPANA